MPMRWTEQLGLYLHLMRWRLTWQRYRPDYVPKGLDPSLFISARSAAARIPDRAVVFSSGIAGNARCSIFFFAIRDRFRHEGHPRNLQWINAGAQGSRGRVPGTVEELAMPGLMTRYLAAHLETARGQLRLAEAGQLEIHTLPQGVIARLLEQFAAGESELLSTVGVGTFLDPRSGRGSAVNPPAEASFVEVAEGQLRYTMPQPDVALFVAPYADREGNVYFQDAATLTESLPSLRAVRRRDGLAMVAVSSLISVQPDLISVPAAEIDHIVVNPYNEQVASVPQRRHWALFTPQCREDPACGMTKLKTINDILGITPRRRPIDRLMSRVAAALFVQHAPPGSLVNIGVGLPEEMVRFLLEKNLADRYLFSTEAGSYGGLPAPGIFFGAAIHPQHLESSSRMFERYRRYLEVAVLGFLELDPEGNVNASRRSDRVVDYVGPGGFPDISHDARTIIFIGTWMKKATVALQQGRVVIQQPGPPKCVDRLREVTFNAQEAYAKRKKVFYVTDLGLFRLGASGLEWILRYPGIDPQRDLLAHASAGLDLPPAETVPCLEPKWIRGNDLHLAPYS